MVSSKNVTGILAVFVVAFMVATAFVPAVNAFASSGNEDADSLTYVKGADSETGKPIAIDGESDIMSFLSSLFGGADLSQLADLFEGQDFRGIIEKIRSADAKTVIANVLANILAPNGEDSEIDDLIEEILTYLKLIEQYLDSLTPESRTIYIPDIKYGPYEFTGITLAVVFDDGEFVSATVSADSVSADVDGSHYEVGDVSLYVFEGGFNFYFGYIEFGGEKLDFDAEFYIDVTDDRMAASLTLFDDLICIEYSEADMTYGSAEIFSFYVEYFPVPWGGKIAHFEGISLTYSYSPLRTVIEGSVQKATCDGVDVTDEANSDISRFLAADDQVSVFQYDELTIGPIDFTDVGLSISKHGDLFTFSTYGETVKIGSNITGTDLLVYVELEQDLFKYERTLNNLHIVDPDHPEYEADFDKLKFSYCADDDESELEYKIAQIRIETDDEVITCGHGTFSAFHLKYADDFVNETAEILVYQDYIGYSSGIVIPGYSMNGDFDGTPSPYALDQNKANLIVRTFGEQPIAYADFEYSDIYGYATLDVDYAVYREPLTYVGQTLVRWGGDVSVDTKAGVGLGRSVELGGNDFFCFYPTLSYDGDSEMQYTVSYSFRDDDAPHEPTGKMEMTVGDNGADIHICLKDLDYTTAPSNETYLSFDEADLYIHFADGKASWAFTGDNMVLGQEDSSQNKQYIRAESVVASKVDDGFTRNRTWTVVMDDVVYCNGSTTVTVSDMFSYSFTVDKDGKITSSHANGELDLNIDPDIPLEIRSDYTIEGRASIQNGVLTSDLKVKMSGQSQVGEITIGESSVIFNLNMSGADFGPFENPMFRFQYGVPTVEETMKQDKIIFREDVSMTPDYVVDGIIDFRFNDNNNGKYTFGELVLGQSSSNDLNKKVSATNFSLEMKDGYTISLDALKVNINDSAQGLSDTVVINLGQANAQAVNIHSYRTDGIDYTDLSFVLEYMLIGLTVDDVTGQFTAGGITAQDYAKFTIKEKADDVDIEKKIEHLAVSMIATKGATPMEFQAVAMSDLNYEIHFDKEAVDKFALQIGKFAVHDFDIIAELVNIQSSADTPGKFTIDSFSSTGFNGGKLVSYPEKDGDPAIIIDMTPTDKTVISIYGLTLDNDAKTGGNDLDIKNIVITIPDDGDADVSVGSVNAVFVNFVFAPTGSTINGSIVFDSKNPLQTAVHLLIDKIADIQEGESTFTNVKYDLSFKDGALSENKLSFDSFWNAATEEDATFTIGASSFDFCIGSYIVNTIIFDDYETDDGREIDGQIEFVSYVNKQALSAIPLFEFKIGKALITDDEDGQFVCSGLTVGLSASTTEAGATITLAVDGEMNVARDGKSLGIKIDEFRAVAKSSADRKNFDLKVTQKVAMVSFYDDAEAQGFEADFSRDVLIGKMEIGKYAYTITGTYQHDDDFTFVEALGESYSAEFVGTGEFSMEVPYDIGSGDEFTMDYIYSLDKMIVYVDGETGEADIGEAGFELSASHADGQTHVDFDAAVFLSIDVGNHHLRIEEAYVGLCAEYDDEGDFDYEIGLSADYIALSQHGNTIEIENLELDGLSLVAGDVIISNGDEIWVEFEDVYVIGGIFYAESMRGKVGDFDLLNLKYYPKEEYGDRLPAYRGIFYLDFDYGITAFMNNEPVVPPMDGAFVFYVPSVEMTFVDDDGEEDTYSVPVNAMVDLGGYYDITPVPVRDLGIPITTDVYRVQDCNVEVTPAKTILDAMNEFGVIGLHSGSGFVYNSEMLSEVKVPLITVVTPQGIVMEISLDALKLLASDCGTTMLGVIMDDPLMYIDELSSVLRSLSDENGQRVMSGMVVSVNTGKSVHTSGLGDVRITVPLDIDSVDLPKLSSYHIGSNTLGFNGSCSVQAYDDGVYATFTVNHFSDFLICEQLDESPTDFTVAAIVLLLAAVAIACIVVQLRRQNTF